ncbi:packaged DNA stabilization gp4 family protein [Allosphingosinicella flava]|nr:packaged DNA stabilization gp4 family protein [Sphingosinicella flava]
MTLRGTIFSDAFEAIGIANYVFDTTAEEQASAARRLDAMMAQWDEEGITLGYTATDGDPQPDVEMTTPAYADDAIALNLALRLAPSFGKEPMPSVKGEAKRAYGLVVAKTLQTPAMHGTRVPIAGGGNWWRRLP